MTDGPSQDDNATSKPKPAHRNPQKSKPGLILVNTGNGKGKTTAALGVALRHAGYGRQVLVLQFIKGTWKYGELESLKLIPNITLVRSGAGFYKIIDDKYPEEVHRQAAAEGLALAQQAVSSGEYSLVVLDEIIYAIGEGLLALADVLEMLSHRRPEVSVILTGRDCPQAIIDVADTVTEMREIKHPFQQGILALKGIDY